MKQMGGLSDITPGRTVRGGSALGARLWHIVISPKGSIAADPSIGWGLPSKLGTKATTTSLKVEAAIGRDELKKDPEVQDAVVVIEDEGEGRYRVRITAIPTEGAAIEFDDVIRGQS